VSLSLRVVFVALHERKKGTEKTSVFRRESTERGNLRVRRVSVLKLSTCYANPGKYGAYSGECDTNFPEFAM
jgi:hypothetical protein